MIIQSIKIVFLLIYLFPGGSWQSRPPPLPPTNKLVKLVTNCTRETLQMRLDLGKPFKGIVFTKDFTEECRTRGK